MSRITRLIEFDEHDAAAVDASLRALPRVRLRPVDNVHQRLDSMNERLDAIKADTAIVRTHLFGNGHGGMLNQVSSHAWQLRALWAVLVAAAGFAWKCARGESP